MPERRYERPRVTVKLSGGLGNQLFQYAAARRVSVQHGAELVLDTGFYDRGRHRQFELNQFPIQAAVKTNATDARWLRQLQGLTKRLLRFDPPAYREPHYHFDPGLLKVVPPVVLEGYFQSPRYFDEIAPLIRQELQPPPPSDIDSQSLSGVLQHPESVALHIRRGDYVSNSKTQKTFLVCPVEYYVRALQSLPGEGPVVVVSDDIDWAKQHLPRRREMLFAGQNAPRAGLADLWLLTQARHHVIANSTFSWWGAWLSNRQQGITIAPANWFQAGTHSCQDLLPTDWHRI